MSEQTSIPVPKSKPAAAPCAWCGQPSVTTRQIEPAIVRKTKTSGGGTKEITVKQARRVFVCAAHEAMIDRNVRAGDLRVAFDRLEDDE